MLSSILLLCLFFGLISTLIPENRCKEWISVLFVVIMCLSVVSGMRDFKRDFPELQEAEVENNSVFPEKEALHYSIGLSVFDLCGHYPISVESDLSWKEDWYLLSQVFVVITEGDPEEVKHELEGTYPGVEINVRKEEAGSG